jgi:hypothetical protein
VYVLSGNWQHYWYQIIRNCPRGGISGSALSAIVPVAALVVAHFPQLFPFVKLVVRVVAHYPQLSPFVKLAALVVAHYLQLFAFVIVAALVVAHYPQLSPWRHLW